MGTYEITEEDQQKMFDTFREILAKYKFDWNTEDFTLPHQFLVDSLGIPGIPRDSQGVHVE